MHPRRFVSLPTMLGLARPVELALRRRMESRRTVSIYSKMESSSHPGAAGRKQLR